MFDTRTAIAAVLAGSAAIASVQLGRAAEPPSHPSHPPQPASEPAIAADSAAAGDAEAAQVFTPPRPAEVRNVLNYYFSPRAQLPVLADFKLCNGVHRSGRLKNECREEILGESLRPGQSVYAWMNFLVPRGQRGRVLMQYQHDGITRDISKFSINGAVRYRTWRRIRLGRSGEWQVPIWFENDAGVQQIERLTIRVADTLADTPPAVAAGELSLLAE